MLREGLEEHPLEGGAVQGEEGSVGLDVARPETGQEGAVRGPEMELLLDATGLGHGAVEPDPPQGEHGVGLDRDPRADLADLRRPLEDLDLEPRPAQGHGGGQAADAASRHEDGAVRRVSYRFPSTRNGYPPISDAEPSGFTPSTRRR